VIPANKAYAEPFNGSRGGVSIPVGYPKDIGIVSNWRDQNKKRRDKLN